METTTALLVGIVIYGLFWFFAFSKEVRWRKGDDKRYNSLFDKKVVWFSKCFAVGFVLSFWLSWVLVHGIIISW